MSTIKWQTALGYAEDSAESARKAILLDFYDPECIGCQQMNEITYQDENVVQLIDEHMVPVRIDFDKRSSFGKYNAFWTPAIMVLDFQGNEVQQTIGYLEPEKFIAMMHLGIAKVHLSIAEHDAANVHFKKIIEQHPESSAVPEAIFFSGVNLFKKFDDPAELKIAYEKLLKTHPESSWAKRAQPYARL